MANLPYETLKFYCNQGLIPNVKRDKNNYRTFDRDDLEWIKNLNCLKKCRFSINEIKGYLNLCVQGKQTIPERKIILSIKRDELLRQIDEIKQSIDYIDKKQGFYDDVLSEKKRVHKQSYKEKEGLLIW